MSERALYRDAGAAMRAAIDRANAVRPRLTGAERAVFDAVLALTASYSKLNDRVYVEEIARIAQVHERTARRALTRLADVGVIVWQSKRGRGASRSLVSLETGQLVPGMKPGESGPEKPGDSCPEKPGSCCPITEKDPEKLSEESALTWIDELGITTAAAAA